VSLQHHLALPRSATSILDAFRRLFEHLYDPFAPQYARDRQCVQQVVAHK
jgi:hypothetical protein